MSAGAPALFRLPSNATDHQKSQWKQQMRRWLSDQLAQQLDVITPAMVQAMTPNYLREWNEKYRTQQARNGNPEPLRKLYPQIADCIFSPPLKQGKTYPRQPEFDVAKVATRLTRSIRALWLAQYNKKHRERDEISAEDFAIDICMEWFEGEAAHLSVDEVKAAAKPSGRHKPRRKNTRQRA
jgi:hypothetical protein